MASVSNLFEKNSTSSQSQLPIDWYLNPEVYALEVKYLLSKAPKYIGHELMTPNAGDFYALTWQNDAKTLINNNGNISLISNICRHRQAVMLNGQGNTSNIVCPLHRWTYDLSGKLLGAPHFHENPCLNLDKSNLLNWHGLLFDISERPHSIAEELKLLGCKQDFDFTGYYFNRADITHYNFNWKTFIEVYLEDYHVSPFHPGLNQFVNCDELGWQFGENYSVQTVGYKPSPDKHLSPVYKKWQESVSQYQQNPPKFGAIWFVYYPFLMIEWYPNVLVISHIVPTGVESCSNVVEFYYPEDIALFEQEYMKAQQAAYLETAIEDQEICQRMHDGRKALYIHGKDERGPYQHPMETGLEHFHLWYRKQLSPYLTDQSS